MNLSEFAERKCLNFHKNVKISVLNLITKDQVWLIVQPTFMSMNTSQLSVDPSVTA